MRALVTALVAFLCAASAAADPPSSSRASARLPAPPIKLARVDADSFVRVVLAPRKGRVVLVSFWATWCGPCVRELPSLARLRDAYEDRDVDVVLVSLDTGAEVDERVTRRLERFDGALESYLHVGDPEALAQRTDPTWRGEIPFTLVFGRDGKQRARLSGAQPQVRLEDAIERALDDEL